MTDNKIIKALECCGNQIDCVGCECVENCPQDVNELNGLALDLINRLQAENEKWQGGYMTQKQEIQNLEIELKAMRGAANSYKAENERLKKENEMFADIGKLYSEIKTEAYKEFAERLKKSKKQYEGTLAGWTFTMTELDNLLKKLVGEDK